LFLTGCFIILAGTTRFIRRMFAHYQSVTVALQADLKNTDGAIRQIQAKDPQVFSHLTWHVVLKWFI
jgi:hypothetical protein